MAIPWGLYVVLSHDRSFELVITNDDTSVNTFGFPLALWVFRNAPGYYHSLRAAYRQQQPRVQPLPIGTRAALNLLFAFALFALLFTLPSFAPPNILGETKARLQIANDTLFARLAALRPLTLLDHALKPHFANEATRLFYLLYGPSVIADCAFCKPASPRTYLYAALPALIRPHLLHLAILGVATSATIAGPAAARWRIHAALLGAALAAADLYAHVSYDHAHNLRATRPAELDFFFWRAHVARGIAFAALDAVFGYVLWLAGTNRFFVRPPGVAERLDALAGAAEAASFRVMAAGSLRNAVLRDQTLMEKTGRYWDYEKSVYEEREVVDAMRSALGSMNMEQLTEMARERVDQVLDAAQSPLALPR